MAIGTKEAYDILKILGRKTHISTIPDGIARHTETIDVNELLAFLYWISNAPICGSITEQIEAYIGIHKQPEDY